MRGRGKKRRATNGEKEWEPYQPNTNMPRGRTESVPLTDSQLFIKSKWAHVLPVHWANFLTKIRTRGQHWSRKRRHFSDKPYIGKNT